MLRVSFELTLHDCLKNEITCFVRSDENGQLQIYYDHTAIVTRPAPKGEWHSAGNHRFELNEANLGLIETGVMKELWSTFGHNIRLMPGELGEPVHKLFSVEGPEGGLRQ